MVRTIKPHGRYRGIFVGISSGISLILWALYDMLHLGQIRLVVALIVLIIAGMFVLNTVPYWNRVLAYANGERSIHRRKKIP